MGSIRWSPSLILGRTRELLETLAKPRIFRLLLVGLIFAGGLGARLGAAYVIPRDVLGPLNDLEYVIRGAALMALEGKDLYAYTLHNWGPQPVGEEFFAYPAGLLWFGVLMLKISTMTGISFVHVAQFSGAILDGSIAVLVLRILKDEPFYRRTLALLLTLFNPFMFSNTIFAVKPDGPLMLSVTLAALYLLESNRSSMASFVYGLSLAMKQFPILLLPYFLYHLPRGRRRAGIGLIAGGFILLSLPFILSEPLTYLQASYLIHVMRGYEGRGNPFAGLLQVWPNPVLQFLVLILFLSVLGLIYVQFIESNPYVFGLLLAFAFISFYWVVLEQYFTWFVPFLIPSMMRSTPRKLNASSSGI